MHVQLMYKLACMKASMPGLFRFDSHRLRTHGLHSKLTAIPGCYFPGLQLRTYMYIIHDCLVGWFAHT